MLFFVLAALYFAPQLQGEKLVQHDVKQYEGMCKDILDNREAMSYLRYTYQKS